MKKILFIAAFFIALFFVIKKPIMNFIAEKKKSEISMNAVINSGTRQESKKTDSLPSNRAPSSGETNIAPKSLKGNWKLQKDQMGFVTRMSGDEISYGMDPVLATHSFLAEYGRSLFGVDPNSMAVLQSLKEATGTQVIMEQRIGGLPIFGTRLNIFYNKNGSIVYVNSNLCSKSAVAAFAAQENAAANMARMGLLRELKKPSNSLEYPLNEFLTHMVKAYRCGNEAVLPIYQFIIPLKSPEFGDMEIEVDARLNQITLMRNQARN